MRVPVRVQELRVPAARLPRHADAVALELETAAAKVSGKVASAVAIVTEGVGRAPQCPVESCEF